jgi:hypothetical protein
VDVPRALARTNSITFSPRWSDVTSCLFRSSVYNKFPRFLCRPYPIFIAVAYSLSWEFISFHKLFKKLKVYCDCFFAKAYRPSHAGALCATNRGFTLPFYETVSSVFPRHLSVLVERMRIFFHFCKFQCLSPEIRGTQTIENFSKGITCSFVSCSIFKTVYICPYLLLCSRFLFVFLTISLFLEICIFSLLCEFTCLIPLFPAVLFVWHHLSIFLLSPLRQFTSTTSTLEKSHLALQLV